MKSNEAQDCGTCNQIVAKLAHMKLYCTPIAAPTSIDYMEKTSEHDHSIEMHVGVYIVQ